MSPNTKIRGQPRGVPWPVSTSSRFFRCSLLQRFYCCCINSIHPAFTDHDLSRVPRVESGGFQHLAGRVGWGHEAFETLRVGSGRVSSPCLDVTAESDEVTRPVTSLGKNTPGNTARERTLTRRQNNVPGIQYECTIHVLWRRL